MQLLERLNRIALNSLVLLALVAAGPFLFQRSQSVHAQDKAGEAKDNFLQIRDGQIESGQRVWIAGPDGRPLMQYPLDELREMERVYRENTQLSGLIESARIILETEESTVSVQAEFIASIRAKNVVRRIDLGLKNCQLVDSPRFETLEGPENSGEQATEQPLKPADSPSDNLVQPSTAVSQGETAGRTDSAETSGLPKADNDSEETQEPEQPLAASNENVPATDEVDKTASPGTEAGTTAEPESQTSDLVIEESLGDGSPQQAIHEQRVIPTNEGYQWLILTSQASVHRLSLNAKTTIDRSSERRAVALELPLVQTVVQVRLPSNAVDERVRSEDLIAKRTLDESGLWLEIRTRGGAFSLTWNQESTTRAIGIVEARSETVYEPFDLLNTSQTWSAITSLSIRWAAATGSQRVLVRLPRGGQWSNLPFSELERFRITTLPAAEANFQLNSPINSQGLGAKQPQLDATVDTSAADSTQLETAVAVETGLADVLVIENLDTAAVPSVENLSLQWRWLPDSEAPDVRPGKYVLQSPELAGVDTHEGSIATVYPSSYQFSYQVFEGTHFIEHSQSLESGTNRDQIMFGFRSSFGSAEVSFRKEPSLPTIRPVHRVHVTEDRLELTTWLHCWFDGSPAEIAWYPAGWQFDESSAVQLREFTIPSTSNVEPLKSQVREDGGFTLSSLQAEPSASTQRTEQVWRLQSHRTWVPAGDSKLEIQLPGFDRGISVGQSRVEFGSGVLMLSGEQYVVLKQDKISSQGIWTDEIAKEMTPYLRPNAGQSHFYRFAGQSHGPGWSGNVLLLPQKTSMSQTVELAVQSRNITVTQNLALSIANRPIESLRMLVRQDALPLQVMLGDASLNYEVLPTNNTPTSSEEVAWSELSVSGFPKIIGESRLVVRSSIQWQPDARNSDNAVDTAVESSVEATTVSPSFVNLEVPLVRVPTAELAGYSPGEWRVLRDPNFDVHLRQSEGPREASQPIGQGVMDLAPGQSSIALAIRQRTPGVLPLVTTNGIWLQTLLTNGERRDRLVARVRSGSQQVTVQLPDQAVLERVALNALSVSQELAPYDYNSNQVAVLLPDDREHVLEVIYAVSQPLSWAQSLHISPATLESNLPLERYYWQLVMPSVYHLGWCPSELTAEWSWKWKSVWWTRESELDQSSLERWMGAASLSRVPTGTNSYVMSGVDQPPTTTVWILSRFAFWLPSGLAGIAIALLLSNVRALRSPNFVILSAAAFGCAALVWPEMSMLFGQTAFAAILLVVMIWLTQAAVGSRVKRRSIFSAGSQSFREISGSGPSLSVRNRQSSLSNSPARAVTADTTGAE